MKLRNCTIQSTSLVVSDSVRGASAYSIYYTSIEDSFLHWDIGLAGRPVKCPFFYFYTVSGNYSNISSDQGVPVANFGNSA
jgi:hypothetical protein